MHQWGWWSNTMMYCVIQRQVWNCAAVFKNLLEPWENGAADLRPLLLDKLLMCPNTSDHIVFCVSSICLSIKPLQQVLGLDLEHTHTPTHTLYNLSYCDIDVESLVLLLSSLRLNKQSVWGRIKSVCNKRWAAQQQDARWSPWSRHLHRFRLVYFYRR